jgi:uncharacterized Zn-finger protein
MYSDEEMHRDFPLFSFLEESNFQSLTVPNENTSNTNYPNTNTAAAGSAAAASPVMFSNTIHSQTSSLEELLSDSSNTTAASVLITYQPNSQTFNLVFPDLTDLIISLADLVLNNQQYDSSLNTHPNNDQQYGSQALNTQVPTTYTPSYTPNTLHHHQHHINNDTNTLYNALPQQQQQQQQQPQQQLPTAYSPFLPYIDNKNDDASSLLMPTPSLSTQSSLLSPLSSPATLMLSSSTSTIATTSSLSSFYGDLSSSSSTSTSTPTAKAKLACHICNSSFTRIQDLNRHLRIHTGEKKFQCQGCKMSFTRKDALDRHVRAKKQKGPRHHCRAAAKSCSTHNKSVI